MFAITFDLRVSDTEQNHPQGISQAYRDIRSVLESFQFRGIQGSVYVTDVDDMANLLSAILALKTLPWFAASARDVRGFRVEMWSDFTRLVKS